MECNFSNRFLYRFRPPVVKPPVVKDGKVVEKQKDIIQELENQEIHLATIEENNDPMDGLQNIFWDGDRILWKNLIKHYCLCLMDSIIKLYKFGNTEFFQHKDIRVWLTPEGLENDEDKELYAIYMNKLLQDNKIVTLLEKISFIRMLDKLELSMLLSLFNLTFLSILNKSTKEKLGHEMIPSLENYVSQPKYDPEKILLLYLSTERKFFRISSEVNSDVYAEMDLWMKYDISNKFSDNYTAKSKSSIVSIMVSFPNAYLDATIEQIYPVPYVACFSKFESKDNCSMWGHYAKGHRGICLIFQPKTIGDREYISLENNEKLFLIPTKYEKRPPELNYFENIIRPVPELFKYWLTDGDIKSDLCKYYAGFNRNEYWERYMEKISYKFKDWDYENEMRAVREGIFPSEQLNQEERNVKYKFEHLRGIIFGIRTAPETKLKIIEIIEHKSKQYGRSDFEFYQAQYSSFEQKLAIRKLNNLI